MSDAQTTTAAAAATTAAATAAAAAAASAAAAKPWFEGKADQEMIGHWDNKGWKKDDPIEIALQATKAARELQKHFGVPETQLLKLPKDATDEAGWNGVYQRLGVPAEAKEYDLSTVKFKDGTEIEPAFTDAMRKVLHDARVPKDKASTVVKAVIDYMDGSDAAESATHAATLKAERESLTKEWGTNFEFNRLTAMQGAKRLGVDPDTVAKLESSLGYAKIMEMFRKVGAGTNEDTFVGGGHGGNPTTQSGAVARKAELMADPEWAGRYLKGDPKAVQEMNSLQILISGVAA